MIPRRPIHLLRCRLRERGRGERGAAAVETLVLASLAVGFIVLVFATARYIDAPAQASDAAYAAARAASLQPTREQAIAAGRQAARDSLAERGKSCLNLEVSFAGTDFTVGGRVVAEVRCTVTLADAGKLGKNMGLQATRVFTERAVVPIEQNRNPL